MATETLEEVRKIGKELRAQAEKDGATIADIQEKMLEYEAALKEAREERDHLRGQLNDEKVRGGRPGQNVLPETLGQRIAKTPAFTKRDRNTSTTHDDCSILTRALTHTTGNVSAIPADYDMELARNALLRSISFLALIPRLRTTSNSVRYFQRTGINALITELKTGVSIGATSLVCETADNKPGASGIRVGSVIVISTGAGAEEATVTAVNLDTNTVTFTALAKAHSAGAQITSDEFTWTSETQTYPRASINIQELTCDIKNVGDYMVVSDNIMDDSQLFADEVDMELPLILRRMMEKMALYGDGNSSEEWQGVLTSTDVLNYAWSDGKVGDTKLDAVRRSITIASLAERAPDTILLNPKDCEDLELQKSDDKMYVNKVVILPDGSLAVWRLPVIETTAIKAGDFLVASFRQGCRFYDREQAETRIFEQDVDNVRTSRLTVRAKGRVGFALREPEAFVYGQFDQAPS